MKLKYYIAGNKTDDYGNGLTELIQTTPDLADKYYWKKEVDDQDVEALKKYFDIVEYDEEKERSNSERFYGTE